VIAANRRLQPRAWTCRCTSASPRPACARRHHQDAGGVQLWPPAGGTLRVSLTLPNERKHEEVLVGTRSSTMFATTVPPVPTRHRPQHHLVPELLAGESEACAACRAGAI
jgi:hypothetical protein